MFEVGVNAPGARVPVPAGAIQCPTEASFHATVQDYLPGGPNAGQSVNIHLNGLQYDRLGIESYECTDGGLGMRKFGNQDGSTEIRYGNTDVTGDAHGAIFRLKNGFATGGLFNVRLNGQSTGDGVGAIWGLILGASFDNDQNRGDVFNYVVRGVESHHVQQSTIKVDGDGGTNGVHVSYSTFRNTGIGDANFEGFGEGVYIGDGNTGRAYSNVIVEFCHIHDVFMGEGIEAKRNGTNVVIRYNNVHDVVIRDGGGIKGEGYAEVYGNRIARVSTHANSTTSNGNGIQMIRGGELYNNVIWDCTGFCLMLTTSEVQDIVYRPRHNTLIATNRSAYGINFDQRGPNQCRVEAEHNAYEGDRDDGPPNGSTFNDVAVGLGDFVGPTSGDADSGAGFGSGYVLSGGPARNAVATLGTVTEDLRMFTRSAPTDAGAFDADALPADPTAPYATNITRWGNNGSTSELLQVGGTVRAVTDLVVVWVYQSNEDELGIPDVSIAGFDHVGQFDPSVPFHGVVDVLAKYVDANELNSSPAYSIDFNRPSEFGKVAGVVVVPDGDLNDISTSFTTYTDVTGVDFPPDDKPFTFHVLGNNDEDIAQGAAFPTGDTLYGFTSGGFRNAGFALSGGSTATGTFPTAKGTFGNISVGITTDAPVAAGGAFVIADDFVIQVDQTVLALTGTTVDDPAAVNVLVNGTAIPATLGPDSWMALLDREVTPLADGITVTLDLEVDGTIVDSVTGRTNERPDKPTIVGLPAELPEGTTALPAFTVGNLFDPNDNIDAISYSLIRRSDGAFWNFDTLQFEPFAVGGNFADFAFVSGEIIAAAGELSTYDWQFGQDGTAPAPALEDGGTYRLNVNARDANAAGQSLDFSDAADFDFAVDGTEFDIDSFEPGQTIGATHTFRGNVPDSVTEVRVRVLNLTTDPQTVRTDQGVYVLDEGDNHQQTAQRNVDEWFFGPVTLPVGAVMRLQVEHD